MIDLREFLTEHDACEPGIDYAQAYTDAREAYDNCDRADWLLWAAGKAGVDLRMLVAAAAACARAVEDQLTDERSREALDLAERFANGEGIPLEELRAAYAAAYAAYAAYAAAYAAYAAAYAAYAAAYAAYAAAWAADSAADSASDSAAYAAAYAASDAAYAASDAGGKGLPDIVRKIIPFDAVERAYNER